MLTNLTKEELLSGSGHYMKNETEKLNKFKLAVFSEAQQQAQSIISQAEAEQKTRLTQAREETHNELLNIIGTLEKETEAKKVREVSSRRLEAQRNILIHRNEMMTRVFDNVKAELEKFCQSDKYEDELKARLEKCTAQRPDSEGTAYFAKRDLELGTKLCKSTGLTPQSSDNIKLGGVMVAFSDCNIAFDCTFDASFEKEKERFPKASGLAQI